MINTKIDDFLVVPIMSLFLLIQVEFELLAIHVSISWPL